MKTINLIYTRIAKEKGLIKVIHIALFRCMKAFFIDLCNEIDQNQERLNLIEKRLCNYESTINEINTINEHTKQQQELFEVYLTDGIDLKIQEALQK